MRLDRKHVCWRGFVTHDNEVIAWPTLLTDHNDFHAKFSTSDEDFAARWRQWGPGKPADIDPGAPQAAIEAIEDFLERVA